MMKPEHVPEGVWRAAMSTYHKTLRKNPGMAWQEAVVAMLNAWPGGNVFPGMQRGVRETPPHIILPLPAEARDE